MFKNLLFHALIGGVIFLVGASLHDFADIRGPGNFIAYGGMTYAALSAALLFSGVNLPSPFNSRSDRSLLKEFVQNRSSKKAREELLEYKKLLDEGVITRDEFDSKACELKKKFL